MVTCKLHNFIFECNGDNIFDTLEAHEKNNVQGTPVVYLQDCLHTELKLVRNQRRDRENSELRESISHNFNNFFKYFPSVVLKIFRIDLFLLLL